MKHDSALGQGKSMYMFSAERLLLSAFCSPLLLALPTEAWQGAESGRRSAENVHVDLSGPLSTTLDQTYVRTWLAINKWLMAQSRS
jgi:hypothetical protein